MRAGNEDEERRRRITGMEKEELTMTLTERLPKKKRIVWPLPSVRGRSLQLQ